MPLSLPLLKDAPGQVIELFERDAIRQTVPAGVEISHEGDACAYFPIVESGIIRVYKLSRDGHEVTLYRLRGGDSCVLTLSCLMQATHFPAHAKTETESVVHLVPAATFKAWTSDLPFWRAYVLGHLSTTLNRIVGLVDHMFFRSVELRIVDALLDHCRDDERIVRATHQDIANEIGSAREVISRHLKDLERDGLVELGRGEIHILDRVGLQRRSELF
jgi:CRP/FNR family transcriptional regulator, anaerobic regulatory protein